VAQPEASSGESLGMISASTKFVAVADFKNSNILHSVKMSLIVREKGKKQFTLHAMKTKGRVKV
jgi:hypothetical protein